MSCAQYTLENSNKSCRLLGAKHKEKKNCFYYTNAYYRQYMHIYVYTRIYMSIYSACIVCSSKK